MCEICERIGPLAVWQLTTRLDLQFTSVSQRPLFCLFTNNHDRFLFLNSPNYVSTLTLNDLWLWRDHDVLFSDEVI